MIDALVLATLAGVGGMFALGLVALASRANLIKVVMGLEILGMGVALLFVLGGYLAGDVGTSQAVVFTFLVIEAVVAAVALALAILAKRAFGTLDVAAIAAKSRGGDR